MNEETLFLWITGDQISLEIEEFPETRELQEMKEIWDFQVSRDSLGLRVNGDCKDCKARKDKWASRENVDSKELLDAMV